MSQFGLMFFPDRSRVPREAKIQRVLEEAEEALAEYVTPEGGLVFDCPGHIVTGSRPA